MLTFLLNRLNAFGKNISEETARLLPEGIGVSEDLPEALQQELARSVPVELYASNAALGSEAVFASLRRAAALGAKRFMLSVGRFCDRGRDEKDAQAFMDPLRQACEAEHMQLLITNRRKFCREQPVCMQKLIRLCERCGTGIAFDVGASHAYGQALEDHFDCAPFTGVLLLNDNFGREALYPVGHPDHDPLLRPDDMRQPGYGTAPFVRIAQDLRASGRELPLFINGSRLNNAALETVLRETRVLLSGKVHINPAGGRIGMNEATGRMLI